MDRPKRKKQLPAKLLESEQIVNRKKVHKLPKNQLKDRTGVCSQLPKSGEKTEVYLSKETEVDLSKEKEANNFSMNLVPSSQFERDDTNPDR